MLYGRDDGSMEHLQATREANGALWTTPPFARA
jgi:hypothetical protein